MMPEGGRLHVVLRKLKADPDLQARYPVIMISAVDEMASVVKCIEMGAEDYPAETLRSGAAPGPHQRLPR